MSVNKKKPAPAAPKPRYSVDVTQTANDDSLDAAIARTLTKPEVSAALTIQKWHGGWAEFLNRNSKLRFGTTEQATQIDDVNNGSMKRPEAMLLAQAHTLDELFNNLARRAQEQLSIQWFESSLRLALKAQGQCRATLETLAAIKNPPVIFAKQANINNGNQQINNGELLTKLKENTPHGQWESTLNDAFDASFGRKHAALIQNWQPWNKSTGPRTPEGKAVSARNAYKGGLRAMMRELSVLLKEQKENMRFKR